MQDDFELDDAQWVTSYTILMNISLIIEAWQWYFIDFIAAELMIITSDGFHGMIHLLAIEQCVFVIFVFIILFINNLLDSFRCFTDTKFLLKIFEDIDIGFDVIFNHLFY